MPYTVFIKHNETGEIREHAEPDDWGDGSDYMWTDGNYGCDYNRHLFFVRAGGTEIETSAVMDNGSCGDERYSIEVMENGKIVYSEK